MTRRKTTTTTRSKGPDWTGREKAEKVITPAISTTSLRCVWHTRVVVSRTLSGKRYDFEPGQVQTVSSLDEPVLLALEKKQAACCQGAASPSILKYFERA